MQITFEKSAAKEILKMLGLKNPVCHYCKTPVIEDNLGGIFPNPTRVCCNDMPCLIDAISPMTN